MPTKISVIYDNPADPAVFEEGVVRLIYPAVAVPASTVVAGRRAGAG
jgi:hypothetical protein